MKILVIKLGALGDVVLAFRALAAIRAHHPRARITALTTPPYASLLAASPWVDDVVIDQRPPAWDLAGLRRLRRQLQGFNLVYDLQTSDRSGWYFWLAGRPAWSGHVRFARHAQKGRARDRMHTIERQRDQLRIAGIAHFPEPDLSWLVQHAPDLPPRPAVLVPGTAPHRPEKRWPVEAYAALAVRLRDAGLDPVVVGTRTEMPMGAAIAAAAGARDLTGRTSLLELAGAFSRAEIAIGGDTGPMHLAASVGCRCIVLFSGANDPALVAPRGDVALLRESNLADLSLERVAAAALARHDCRSPTETN